jgi:hypothetical protein
VGGFQLWTRVVPHIYSVQVVKCDQTSVLSHFYHGVVRKRDDHKAVQLLPKVRLTYVNDIDRSSGVVAARWRGLGIFTPGPLAVPRMNALPLYLISHCGIREGSSVDPLTLFQVS